MYSEENCMYLKLFCTKILISQFHFSMSFWKYPCICLQHSYITTASCSIIWITTIYFHTDGYLGYQNLKFLNIYFRESEQERVLPHTGSLHQIPATVARAGTRSQEHSPGLPWRGQGPRNLSHHKCFPGSATAGSCQWELETSTLTSVLKQAKCLLF